MKKERKLNLILHNVPESKNESRKQDDTDTAMAIINQHLGVPMPIFNTTRLGSKVRLLRITVSSERNKAIILRKHSKIC